jgi:hypothetical protein
MATSREAGVAEVRYLEDAETHYNDFRGSCAFDQRLGPVLEDVLGLPDGHYWVLGFRFGGVVEGGDEKSMRFPVTVCAVRRTEIENCEALRQAASAGGQVPVVEIRTDATAEDLLRAMQEVEVTALAAAVELPGWRLRIDEELDLGR